MSGCERCGGAVAAQRGPGRPRRLCDACRPAHGQRTCTLCASTFWATGERLYCSRSCAVRARHLLSGRDPKTTPIFRAPCEACAQPVYTLIPPPRSPRFCSQTCSNARRFCRGCGQQFLGRGPQRYCTPECKSAALQKRLLRARKEDPT